MNRSINGSINRTLALGALVVLAWPATAVGAEQGDVVELNGVTAKAQWWRRPEGFYIEESWFEGVLGGELLSSEQVSQQRVKWYSSPFFVSTQHDRPVRYRYFNLQPLLETWSPTVRGKVLRLTTPALTVTALRRSPQPWGDRLALDLSGPAPWQLRREGNTVTLEVGAEAPANSIEDTATGTLLEALSLQTRSRQTQVRLQVKPEAVVQVTTLADPPRLIVDVRNEAIPSDRDIAWSEGIRYREQTVMASTGRAFPSQTLEINLRQPGLKLRPLWNRATGMVGTVTLPLLADRHGVAAALNGGFFNVNRQVPVGPVRLEGRWLAGPVLERGAIAWNDEGRVAIERLRYQEEIEVGNRVVPLTELNSGYVRSGIARYTPDWGATYQPLTDNETIVPVRPQGGVLRIGVKQAGGKAGEKTVPIPSNGYLLVARNAGETLSLLREGEVVQGTARTVPPIFSELPYALGGGPLLLREGQTVLDTRREGFRPPFDRQGAPRSVVATTINGTLLLTAIGGAPTLPETVDVLRQLGAHNALNLDGGGSSTLYLGGRVRNRRQLRPIHNALGIVLAPPPLESF
ncbi:MAG: phosphodiester glycosidase family protein [Pseudanabaenaceae cyanobacterium]